MNKIDTALRSYGRNEADKSRPVHVRPPGKTTCVMVDNNTPSDKLLVPDFEAALGFLLDPATGSAANSRKVLGVLCLHVDDLLFAGQMKCTSKSSTGSGRNKRWARRTRMM